MLTLVRSIRRFSRYVMSAMRLSPRRLDRLDESETRSAMRNMPPPQ